MIRLNALIGIILLVLVAATARGADDHDHHEDCNPPGLKPGDYSYGHCAYHDIYSRMRKEYDNDHFFNSCCNDGECRVTHALEEPTPQEKLLGFDYRVFIEGEWCPVKKSALVNLPPDLKEKLATDPHVQGFARQTHVCAPKESSFVYREGIKRERSRCPSIYCIFDGGWRT